MWSVLALEKTCSSFLVRGRIHVYTKGRVSNSCDSTTCLYKKTFPWDVILYPVPLLTTPGRQHVPFYPDHDQGMSDRLLYAIGTGAAVLWRIMIDMDERKNSDYKVVQKVQIRRMFPAFYTSMTESVIQNI